jgi:predicted CoA-binding protein
MASEAAARKFFSSSAFAVAGASSNPLKFGHKVHAWYLAHNLPVTPINPASQTISVGGKDYPAVPNVAGLENPKQTGLSVITHPAITIGLLKEAKEAGIPAVFLQPGTYDDDVLEYALADGTFESVVYGFGEGTRGGEGWCVLVDGEKQLKELGKL